MSTLLPPTATISPILRDAVKLKSEELARAKASFKDRYLGHPQAEVEGNAHTRLSGLLERIKKLDPYLEHDDELFILTRYVQQARDDRSMTEEKLLRLEKDLISKLSKHKARLEVSSLHIDLLKEVLEKSSDESSLVKCIQEKASLEDEFEMVEGGLEDVLEKFEKHAFTAKDIDTIAIEEYLASLIDNDNAKAQLGAMRERIAAFGEDLMCGKEKVEEEMVLWCIADLLKNGLLSDDKRTKLQGYVENPIALREVTSMLNMKSVRHWKWNCGDKGLPVTARQNIDGKYCIAIDEDVIDLLFLHTIAVGWSIKLRKFLTDEVKFKGLWPGNQLLTAEECEKREYYLGAPPPKRPGLCPAYHSPPPPPTSLMYPPVGINMPNIFEYPPRAPMRRRGAPMPPPPPPPAAPQPKMKKKATQRYSYPLPPPPPPSMTAPANLNDERFRIYLHDFFLSRLPNLDDCVPTIKSSHETQASLIKILATELKVREAFDGSVHTLSADFDSFASSLPHETILTVLKFIGMPEGWLDFFGRFLAAPLNMGPIVRGTSDQILTRTCGIPIAHGLEPFFTEALLFFLDLAAHRKTGAYIYRLRDSCYFVGKEAQCTTLRSELFTFASTMGLKVRVTDRLNPIGFLRLNSTPSDPVSLKLDIREVESYARRLKKQLAEAPTVVSWIRTWNATIGTYAEHLFGPLANVFGTSHLDSVIDAHNRIQDILFPGSNLTAHVKTLLTTHLGRPLEDPPFALEALIYLPLAYGGLGVKNPYVTLNLARGTLLDDPNAELTKYLDSEKVYYEKAKENFLAMKPETQADKLDSVFHENKARAAEVLGKDVDATKFITYEDFCTNRERFQYPYLPISPYPIPCTITPLPNPCPAYNILLSTPPTASFTNDKIADGITRLAGKLDMKRLYKLSNEERWTLQLYGEECFERYGGLEVWHRDSVPRAVLKVVRGESTAWDDDDDNSTIDSSVSDLTEA